MPVPAQYGYPVRRQGLIISATWQGADDDLTLEVLYQNENGSPQIKPLTTSNAGGYGEICLPTSGPTVNDLSRDALIASVRMATLISKTIPGSKEWLDAVTTGQETSNFQTALGTVKIKEVRVQSDTLVEIDFVKNGTSSPIKTVLTDFQEVGTYTFTPDTQMLCVAGAIEKEFPTYQHNYPGQVLSAQQKAEIAAYVPTLALWI